MKKICKLNCNKADKVLKKGHDDETIFNGGKRRVILIFRLWSKFCYSVKSLKKFIKICFSLIIQQNFVY
ncbi:MAG: hypothetical protein EA362_10590 [Saprospirales bacterium]|nr:MAG: hypothetical protein EA362_10590 [Saprospirales bacterium]